MLFGDPIYLPENPTDEDIENVRQEIENSLNELYTDIKKNFDKYLKQKP